MDGEEFAAGELPLLHSARSRAPTHTNRPEINSPSHAQPVYTLILHPNSVNKKAPKSIKNIHIFARKGWFSWLKRGHVSSWSQVRLPKGAEFVIMPPGSEPVALRCGLPWFT